MRRMKIYRPLSSRRKKTKEWRRIFNLHALQQNYPHISLHRKGRPKCRRTWTKPRVHSRPHSSQSGIVFEGMHLGRVPTMKFEYWDLADHENFPHLDIGNLMKQNTTGVVTTLESLKWLRGVEKARLLNLLWVSHFHHVPITHFHHQAAALPGA